MEKQIVSSSYDKDTGILNLRLLTGEQYYVTNAGHARILKEKISPGGKLNTTQATWLEKYRVPTCELSRAAIRAKIKSIREGLHDLKK